MEITKETLLIKEDKPLETVQVHGSIAWKDGNKYVAKSGISPIHLPLPKISTEVDVDASVEYYIETHWSNCEGYDTSDIEAVRITAKHFITLETSKEKKGWIKEIHVDDEFRTIKVVR